MADVLQEIPESLRAERGMQVMESGQLQWLCVIWRQGQARETRSYRSGIRERDARIAELEVELHETRERQLPMVRLRDEAYRQRDAARARIAELETQLQRALDGAVFHEKRAHHAEQERDAALRALEAIALVRQQRPVAPLRGGAPVTDPVGDSPTDEIERDDGPVVGRVAVHRVEDRAIRRGAPRTPRGDRPSTRPPGSAA